MSTHSDRRSRRRLLSLSVMAGGMLLTAMAFAADSNSPSELAARGSVTYRVYCSRCHGPAGKGDGKLAASLKDKPADLTTIASRNHGEFQADQVLRRVDGRDQVPGHETDMPSWGLSLQDPARDSSQEKDVQAKLAELVAYLKTLQPAAAKP